VGRFIIEYDMKALFTAVAGGSDGTIASAWVMKEASARSQSKPNYSDIANAVGLRKASSDSTEF
jgi:hypothetical protein